MKYLDSYKDPLAARGFIERIRRETTRPWVILEACGGQAHNLLRFGADRDLPESLEIVHGPSCPVSATPARFIDRALAIAARPGVLVAAPGDLLRVPGAAPAIRSSPLKFAARISVPFIHLLTYSH